MLGVGVGVGVGVNDGDDNGVAVDNFCVLTIEVLGVGTTIVDQLEALGIIDEEGRTLIVFTGNVVKAVGVGKEVGGSVNDFDDDDKDEVEDEAVIVVVVAREAGFMVPPCILGLLTGAIVCVGITVTVSNLVTVAIPPVSDAAAILLADVGHKPSIGTCDK